MAVKMKGKGTIFSIGILGVFTAVPLIQKISKTGEKIQTYPSHTLDQSGAGMTHDQSGYVEPPKISVDLFYDASDPVHISLKDLVRTPIALTPFTFNVSLTYTDLTLVTEVWAAAGIGWDEDIESSKGVSAKLTIECTGDVNP